MTAPTITEASITQDPAWVGVALMGTDPKVLNVKLSDGTTVERVITWYSDELTFTEDEFIGKTLEEAKKLHFERDVAYLQSP